MQVLKGTEAQWLQDCLSQTLQMALRNLDNAYFRFRTILKSGSVLIVL